MTKYVAALALALACSPASGSRAQSPERQSEAEYDLAREYFFKGNSRVGLDHAMKAVTLDDHNTKALYFTSVIYLSFCADNAALKAADCKLKDAERVTRKALEVDPTFRDARNMLGNILILEEKYPEAIATLQPLVNDPSYNAVHLAWGNLGWAQVRAGLIDEGIASLRNAVTQPKFCVGFYRLGAAYVKKGDLAQAEANFTQALTADPECEKLQEAWHDRGEIRLKLNHHDEACVDFAKCHDLAGDTDTGKSCGAEMLKASCAAPKAS